MESRDQLAMQMHSQKLARMRIHQAKQIHQYEVLKKLAKCFNLSNGSLSLLRADAFAEEDFDILEALHNSDLSDLPECLRIEAEPVESLARFQGKTLYKSTLWGRLADSLHRYGEVLTVLHVKNTGDYVMCTEMPNGGELPDNGPCYGQYRLDGRDVWMIPIREYVKLKEEQQYG